MIVHMPRGKGEVFTAGSCEWIMGLARVINQPRIASYYMPDVVQLVGVGMCFGFAIGAMVSFWSRET